MRISRFAFCFLALLAVGLLSAVRAAVPTTPPTNDAMTDLAWDLWLDSIPEQKQLQAIDRALKKTPDDVFAQAQRAKRLVFPQNWKLPAGREAEGVALADVLARRGNPSAQFTLGLAKCVGTGTQADAKYGEFLLRTAAESGNVDAMRSFGLARARPNSSDAELVEAEEWLRLAAKRGSPDGLLKLAAFYETPPKGRAASLEKAAPLLYEAAIFGSKDAYERLRKISRDASAPAPLRRAAALSELWFAALGSEKLVGAKVKLTAAQMEALYPKDPLVLVALGRLYRSGEFQMRDFEKAYALFGKAVDLGSDDALAERAKMLAEGAGVPADHAAALAIWRELDKKGNARARAQLGYYHYWGSLDGLPKDEKAAYAYSRLAAADGDISGQLNTAYCFAHGIGTGKDYKLAAAYCYNSARRGHKKSADELPKFLSAAFN